MDALTWIQQIYQQESQSKKEEEYHLKLKLD